MVNERAHNIEWKDIKGFEGLYKINNVGQIYSYYKNDIRKNKLTIYGYLTINLKKDNKYYFFPVHRLVAEHFIPNTNNFPVVNHINEIKTDNRVENLEWCTKRHNTQSYWDNKIKRRQSENIKISDKYVDIIRDIKNNFKCRDSDLAKIFGVGTNTINRIVNFKRRK